jgi:signal-transduction protein with cAMP-binding, CBS, and nucleotidyltransferase domain
MSLPIVSVQSRYSILGASKMMDKMRLHRLVIVDGRAVCGIVTQTDIMRAVQNAIEEGEGERRSLFAELAGLVRYLMDDLKELEYFLQEVNGFPAARSRPARKTDEPVDK